MPGSIGDSGFTQLTQVKTKLPKLQLNKFNGDPKVWNEWWDSYECAIHNNVHISDVAIFCEVIRRTKLHLLLQVYD